MVKPNGIELSQDPKAFSEDLDRGSKLFLEKRVVAVFGGSSLGESSEYCRGATALSRKLAESGITVITGGGPGIMNAANEGAKAVDENKTYGLRVAAIHDENIIERPNIKEGHLMVYRTLSVRLLTLIGASNAIVFFPGGFGTLEEMFSLLVRIRVNMMKKIPVFFYDTKFWGGLKKWLEETVLGNGLINSRDMDLMQIEDDIDEIVKKILGDMPG